MIGLLWKSVGSNPTVSFQYIAMDYLDKKNKELRPEDFPKLKQLAQTKSWWDSIDQLDLIIGEVTFHYPETKNIMRQWSLDEDFWLRRIAIDHQLMRKDLTDTALLAEVICNNFGQTEFFINKAIGWSLRNYSKVNPDWFGLLLINMLVKWHLLAFVRQVSIYRNQELDSVVQYARTRNMR